MQNSSLKKLANFLFHLFQSNDAFRTETRHLICSAYQITGFYMKLKTGQKWVLSRLKFLIRSLAFFLFSVIVDLV